MNNESQNIEYKESWRDEYLKWICGFANAFFRAGEIETWGRGIERIINGCKDAGCPKPTFECRSGEIWTVFHYKKDVKTSQESTLKSTLKGTQKKILEIISENAYITIPKVAEQLNLNVRGVAKHFKSLQEQGFLRRVGPDKGGYWKVVEKT